MRGSMSKFPDLKKIEVPEKHKQHELLSFLIPRKISKLREKQEYTICKFFEWFVMDSRFEDYRSEAQSQIHKTL